MTSTADLQAAAQARTCSLLILAAAAESLASPPRVREPSAVSTIFLASLLA
jgi:hypothetical protein